MTTSAISLNPNITTNATGTFSATTYGMVQGIAMDDPNIRNSLAGGVLASTETLPMWGGVVIGEYLNLADEANGLGNNIERAANQAGATGMTVYNQLNNAITTPQSNAPAVPSGGTVNFYRFGSHARIAVQCDPALVSLNTGLINQQVSWDYVNQKLIAYNATPGAFPCKILNVIATGCMIVQYNSGTGFVTWNFNGACALIEI